MMPAAPNQIGLERPEPSSPFPPCSTTSDEQSHTTNTDLIILNSRPSKVSRSSKISASNGKNSAMSGSLSRSMGPLNPPKLLRCGKCVAMTRMQIQPAQDAKSAADADGGGDRRNGTHEGIVTSLLSIKNPHKNICMV